MIVKFFSWPHRGISSGEFSPPYSPRPGPGLPRGKFLILISILVLGLAACSTPQAIDPQQAQAALTRAWQTDRHAVWEIDWPAAPTGGPVTVETWQATDRYRYEILESTAPELVGQMLFFDGQQAWLDDRFDLEPAQSILPPHLSPVSEAFAMIDRLLASSPVRAASQKTSILNHGPVQKTELTYPNGGRLVFWLEPEQKLPVRIVFSADGDQARLDARHIELLLDPRSGLFTPLHPPQY